MGTDAPNPRVFRIRTASVILLLAVTTVISYWPLVRNGFVTLDDTQYLTYNPHVTPGLTWHGFLWAFQTGYACNWHPLTWLSHMLDCQLFGLNPLGHHLVSLGLHIAVTLLVFQLLHQATHCFWRSAIVAAFFALHPLHVESVAWASERKDVLSAFFFLLTLLAFARYVSERSPKSDTKQSECGNDPARGECRSGVRNSKFKVQSSKISDRAFYLLSLFLFALGLMSKPMVVTLPFVLLLLDFWPLQRTTLGVSTLKLNAGRLVLEKVPFFLLSIGASIITYRVQNHGGAVTNFQFHPVAARIANMFVSYVHYVAKTFWPVNLTVVYPYQHWPVALVAVSGLLVALTSCFACFRAGRFPYMFVGWFWFLGMLVPVIGLVQVGSEAMAERYMYLPSIGLFVATVWAATDLYVLLTQMQRSRRREEADPVQSSGCPPAYVGGCDLSIDRFATAAILLPALALCATATFSQTKTWRNGETLFARAVSLFPHDPNSLSGWGAALAAAGRNTEALPPLAEASRLDSTSTDAQFNLATVLMSLGRSQEAIAPLESLAKRLPARTDAHMSLGCAYFNVGRFADAEGCFTRAVGLDPEDPQPRYNLSMALIRESKMNQAFAELASAVRLDRSYVINAAAMAPRDSALHYYLGTVLLMQSHDSEGIAELLQAARLDPNLGEAHRNLGLVFKKQGQIDRAIQHLSEVVRISPESIDGRLNLAAAFLDAGRPKDAINQLDAALALAPGDPAVHCRLAAAEVRNHESGQAIAHYREALRLSPGLPEAQHELAVLLNR